MMLESKWQNWNSNASLSDSRISSQSLNYVVFLNLSSSYRGLYIPVEGSLQIREWSTSGLFKVCHGLVCRPMGSLLCVHSEVSTKIEGRP